MSKLANSVVFKISKMTTKQLEDLLYDIDSWEAMNGKLHDIQDAIDVIVDTRHAYTQFSANMLQEFNYIKDTVASMMDRFEVHFQDLDINDDNVDYIYELLEEQLTHKLRIKLLRRLKSNKDICNNIDQYMDDYFNNYKISRKVENRLTHMQDWITNMHEAQNDIKNGNLY